MSSASPTNHNLLITRMKGWDVYVRPGVDTNNIADHSVLLSLEKGNVAAYFYETPEKCICYLPVTGLDIDELLTQFTLDKEDKIQRVYHIEPAQRTGLKSLLKKTVNKIADVDSILQTLIDLGAPSQIMGLGYISNDKGICAGLTGMWTQAKLLGQEHAFFERIQFICSHDNLKTAIQQAEIRSVAINNNITAKYAEAVKAVRVKLKENPSNAELIASMQALQHQAAAEKHALLTEDEKKLLDVKPFLDGIDIYQQPESYAATKKFRQKDISEISAITASVELEDRGGAHKVYEKSLQSTAALDRYFETLASLIQAQRNNDLTVMDHSPTDDLAITIASDDHIIGVSYSHNENAWTIIDSASKTFAVDFKKLTTAELPDALLSAFENKTNWNLRIVSAGNKNELGYKNFLDTFSRSLAAFKKPVAPSVAPLPTKNISLASALKMKDENQLRQPLTQFFKQPVSVSSNNQPKSRKRKKESESENYPVTKKRQL